jgi:8-oxo-dGTP diphosphatase
MTKVAVGIIVNNGKVLLCQRKKSDHYGLKWEFPGGKFEPGESAEQCLRRELAEELGIQATVGLLYHQQHAVYADSGTFDVFYYSVPSFQGTLVNHAFEMFVWVSVRDLPLYDILEGNRDVINKLLADDEIHQRN